MACAAVALLGCSSREAAREAPKKANEPAALAEKSAVDAAAPPDDGVDARAKEWTQVALEDDLPLCVFGSYEARYKAEFLAEVRKQRLRANASAVFGAFPPRACLNDTCDHWPTLQCWVDIEPNNTIVVHTRFTEERKIGATCTDDCRPVFAGCETPKLAKGTYTVRYGSQTYTLEIPSVMSDPCLRRMKE